MSRKEPPQSTKNRGRPAAGPVGRLAGAVAGLILFLLALPFLLLAAWGLLFNTPTLAVVAFTAAWILFPLFNGFKAIRLFKFGVSFLVIPAALALAPFMMNEVDQQVEQLSQKPRNDMSEFTLRDRIGIYGLNIVMGVAGYPLYPEASKETMLMMFDPGPSARRVFYSGFGLGSYKLRAPLRDFAARLKRGDTACAGGYGPVSIEWDKSQYRLTDPEARYALALNETMLTATAERRGRRWLIDVRHEMEVKYPQQSVYVTLVGRPRLRVEEGLFWVLQNCGWLHPYTAEYRFLVFSDDPRLN